MSAHHPMEARQPCDDDTCEVCGNRIARGAPCSVDISLGFCHAECLEGSPTVDLSTGEPMDGPIPVFPYVPDADFYSPAPPDDVIRDGAASNGAPA